MKKLLALLGNSWIYTISSCLLAFLLVFTSFPHEVLSQDLKTEELVESSDQEKEGSNSNISVNESIADEIVIITLDPEGITEYSATLKGQIAQLGANEDVQIGFQYGEDAEFRMTSEIQTVRSAGEFSVRLQNLKPATLYHYRAYAIGEDGEVNAAEMVFTTLVITATGEKGDEDSDKPALPEVLPLEVETGKAILRGNSLILRGILSGTENLDSIEVYFEYGSDNGYGERSKITTMTHPGPFSISIPRCNPGETYHYRAVAEIPEKMVCGEDAVFDYPAKSSPPKQTKEIPETTPVETAPLASIPEEVDTVVEINVPQPEKTSKEVEPDKDNEVRSANNRIKLEIPKGAIDRVLNVELTDFGDSSQTGMVSLFELNAFEKDSNTKVSQFNKALPVTIQHSEKELRGLNLDSLKLYYLDENTRNWVGVKDCEFDQESMVMTANLTHFSNYGEQADPLINGPGRVMAGQVDLFSGSAMFSYPIELPPGPGGFQPKISLSYNSASVNEMKNRRSMGSWVGVGWSLNLGNINLDPASGNSYLEVNGSSFKLVTTDGIHFRTNPEQHYQITRCNRDETPSASGNTWIMLDTEGTSCRFGGTDDSEQYLPYEQYFRWDLTQFKDVHDNTANISYVQNIRTYTTPSYTTITWVRSAYPEYLRYNNDLIEIHFISSSDMNDLAHPSTGFVRYDDPLWTEANESPRIMEDRHLDSILIKVNDNFLRQYHFTYAKENSKYYEFQYDGIYYSGSLSLTSISQVGLMEEGKFNSPQYVAIDNRAGANYIYVSDEFSHRIQKFDLSGNYLGQFGSFGDGNGELNRPKGIAVDNNGNVYVCDYGNQRIQKFDANGDFVWVNQGSPILSPWGIAYNAVSQRVYVTNTFNNSIKAYNVDGSSSESYGTYGSGDGFFISPTGIATDISGNVYVCDTGNNRIQKFGLTGQFYMLQFTDEWGSYGSGNSYFSFPEGIVASGTNLYISDSGNNRVKKYSNSGTYSNQFGSLGSADGDLINPKGIAIDSSGNIYVCNNGNQRIEKFNSSYAYVTYWGSILPPMSFVYEQKNISFTDGLYAEYSGNPGNPANISWPFLMAINSGYGGTISFIYTLKPDSSTNNVWRRQIVTKKEVDPGIGTIREYFYSYPDGQVLLGTRWTAQFRGFGRVKEKDSTNNYIMHYFYTTEGKESDEEKLSGREYKTHWYQYVDGTNDTLLKEVKNSWTWKRTSEQSAGTFVRQFGSSYLTSPNGIAVTGDGSIYVASYVGSSDTLTKFNADGSCNTAWNFMPWPVGLDIAASSEYTFFYLSDFGTNSVLKYNSDGVFLGTLYLSSKQGPTDIYAADDGSTWVVFSTSDYVVQFEKDGTHHYYGSSTYLSNPQGFGLAPDGVMWISSFDNNRLKKRSLSGSYYSYSDTHLSGPKGIAVSDDLIYVCSFNNDSIVVFNPDGSYHSSFTDTNLDGPTDIAIDNHYIYVTSTNNNRVVVFTADVDNWEVQLSQVEETTFSSVTGNKTSRTRYALDDYGNTVTEFHEGDVSTSDDDSTVWRTYYPNTTANILNKPARERVYAGIVESDSGGSSVKNETRNYYDYEPGTSHNNTNWQIAPVKGDLTRLEQFKDASNSISSYFIYDGYGNNTSEQDPNGNITSRTYEDDFNTYPEIKTYPSVAGGQFHEHYTYDPGTNNLLSQTDINSITTSYQYDSVKRLIAVDKPLEQNPDIQYEYNNWGTLGQQHIKTMTWASDTSSLWKSDYFDGLGQVIQTHSNGETGHVIISGTTEYNNIGLASKQYVAQDYLTSQVGGYIPPNTAPVTGWKYTSYVYDALGRVSSQTNADSSVVNHDYSAAWQTTTTNALGNTTTYLFDAFNRLSRVTENIDTGTYIFKEQIGSSSQQNGKLNHPQGIAADEDGKIYVADTNNHRIQKFDANGAFICQWGGKGSGLGQFDSPSGIAVSSTGYVFVADTNNHRIQKFDTDGNYITQWGTQGSGDGQFESPKALATYYTYVYVADTGNNRVQRFKTDGEFVSKWETDQDYGSFSSPRGIAVSSSTTRYVYVADTDNSRIVRFTTTGEYVSQWNVGGYPRGLAASNGSVYMADSDNDGIRRFSLTGSGEIQISSSGAGYGYLDGPMAVLYASSDLYVADTENNLVQRFDGGTYAYITQFGDLSLISPYDITLDSSNNLYILDLNGAVARFTPNNTYIKQWGNKGSGNGQLYNPWGIAASGSHIYVSDTWNHRVEKFSNSGGYSSKWGSQGSGDSNFSYPAGIFVSDATYISDSSNHRVKIYDSSNTLLGWIGRGTVTTGWHIPGSGETGVSGGGNGQFNSPEAVAVGNGYIYVADTNNHRIQMFNSTTRAYYSKWGSYGTGNGQFKYPEGIAVDSSGYVYVTDTSNHRIQKFDANGNYITQWGTLGTEDGQFEYPYGIAVDSNGDVYVADANKVQRFTRKALTSYKYDIAGNLLSVRDTKNNTTTIEYDWLSRKENMYDPDMGNWQYTYDNNGNLITQTDAIQPTGHTISMTYDALNRLTLKDYVDSADMTDVIYTFDSTTDGNYGLGRRTSMSDALGTNSATFRYDARGRLVSEDKVVDSVMYTTDYEYDGIDRLTGIIYPGTIDMVIQGYNNRGLPHVLGGRLVGDLVDDTLYNNLGSPTQINLHNGLTTHFGYWGYSGMYDNNSTGTGYGRLWKIKTGNLQEYNYTWDNNGNLMQREDVVNSQTESFTYDVLDRLLSVSGPYSETYTYNGIGNITTKNGIAYSYGAKPHAVTAIGASSLTYDGNGNMLTGNGRTLTWDWENRVKSETKGGVTTTFTYDGDGNRVKKTVVGSPDVTTIYVNRYFEKTGTEITTSYYLGSRLVAQKKGSTLSYVLQDHLGSTSATADSNGALNSTINYYSFGLKRFSTGTLSTDVLYTGQKKVSSTDLADGLYYYNARYYDTDICRFVSPDTIVPNPMNPQSLNRYSYCLNNPLKYVDPSGYFPAEEIFRRIWEGRGGDGGGGGGGGGGGNSQPDKPDLPGSNSPPVDTSEPTPSLPSMDPLEILKAGGVICLGLVGNDAIGIMVIDDALIPFVIAGTIGYCGGALIINGVEYNSSRYDNEEMAILYADGGYLYVKSQDKMVKSVGSYIKLIQEHEGKISGSPGSPNKGDWEKHIIKALNNIKKELDKMGPAARQRAIELLNKSGIIVP